MSVRLLTTALILLLQSAGQQPADQDLATAAPPAGSLLFGVGVNSDAGLAAEVAQQASRLHEDVFPLFRLADEYPTDTWMNTGYGQDTTQLLLMVAPPIIANQAEELECLWQLTMTGTDGSAPAQARDRRWSCRKLGMMALGHLCPPIRLCSFYQQHEDPCVAMVRRAARQCGSLWAGCFAQAPSQPCHRGCPYPYGRPAACEEPCEEPAEECQEPIEDCSAAQPEAIEGLPQEAESAEDRCTCCNGKCQCTSPCACSKDAEQCSCCNKKCCCNDGKCQCSDCAKDQTCACAGGKCGCKDGACKCAKASAVKHECPYLKAKAAQAKARAKLDRYAQREVTVLDNLEKLALARQLHEKAKHLEKAGAHGLAEHCYRRMAKVCPGSRYEALAQAGLAALREHRTLAKATILDQARRALEQGDFDTAYRLAEQAYGEAYAVMAKAAELLRVIDSERFQTGVDVPGVEEAEPRTCDPPLPCEPQTYVPECIPIAVEVKVAEYLEACQRALTAGCFDEALQLAQLALGLDPGCGAAELLLEKAKAMIRYEEEQEDTGSCTPEKGDEPCEIDPEAHRHICPTMPAVDPAIVHVLQRLLAEQDQCLQPAGGEEEQQLHMPADWQYLELYIDPEECDGYSPPQQGTEAPDREPPLADAGELIRQLIQAVRGGSCIEVDTGSSQGPRVWIQVGGAHCRVNLNGGTVHFVHGGMPADHEQDAATCEVSIHIKWGGHSVVDRVHGGITYGQGCLSVDDEPDLRDWQAAHEQEVIHWIESMNSGGVEECETPGCIINDDEDVDVNRDPCDG